MPAARANRATAREWRKPVRVELTLPARGGKRPVLKTGRATGPRELPVKTLQTPGADGIRLVAGLLVEESYFAGAGTLG